MNNNLELIEKAAEIFDLCVEIEKSNSQMSKLIDNTKKHSPELLQLQDELFSKRLLLKKLEEEYETIKEECKK